MTLGASECVKMVGSVNVVTGCGHWVVDTLLTINYPYSSCECLIGSFTPRLLSIKFL